MELIDHLGRTPYFDSNIIIYCLEGYPAYQPLFNEILKQLDSGTIQPVTSLLTLAEVLVLPKKKQLPELEMLYFSFLYEGETFSVKNIDNQIVDQAASFRAHFNFKLPDSIHLATAVQHQCTSFFTNDHQFKNLDTIAVVTLDDLK